MITLEDLTSELKGKSILIIGGSGFFGKNLCESLVELNQRYDLDLKIVSMARTPIKQAGVEFIQQDVTKPFEINSNFDFIIHAATPVVGDNSNFDKNLDIIVNGTYNALKFAEKSKCSKFLLVSSGAVYGKQPQELDSFSEDYQSSEEFFDFNSAYTSGKRISELQSLEWSRRTGKNLTIARCFAFSGKHLPIDQHLAIGNFIKDAIDNKLIKIKGDGSPLRSYMDAEDLVLWLMTILLHGKNEEIYNVGSSVVISMKELAEVVAKQVPGTKVLIENSLPISGKRNKYIPCLKKTQTKLNLRINITLEESIKKMIEFNRGLK